MWRAMSSLCEPSPPAMRTSPLCSRQRRVGIERAGDERLLQPGGAVLLERRQARCRGRQVMTPDGAGVDEDDPVVAEPLARGRDLLGVLRHAAQPVRSPAELGRDVALVADALRLGQRLRRRISEQDGGIGQARLGALIPQELVDRRLEAAAEQIPHGDVDAGEGVRRLQEIEAVGADEIADAVDIGNRRRGSARARSRAPVCRRCATWGRRGWRWRPAARPRTRPSRRTAPLAAGPAADPGCRRRCRAPPASTGSRNRPPRSAFLVNLLLRVVLWARTVSGWEALAGLTWDSQNPRSDALAGVARSFHHRPV